MRQRFGCASEISGVATSESCRALFPTHCWKAWRQSTDPGLAHLREDGEFMGLDYLFLPDSSIWFVWELYFWFCDRWNPHIFTVFWLCRLWARKEKHRKTRGRNTSAWIQEVDKLIGDRAKVLEQGAVLFVDCPLPAMQEFAAFVRLDLGLPRGKLQCVAPK